LDDTSRLTEISRLTEHHFLEFHNYQLNIAIMFKDFCDVLVEDMQEVFQQLDGAATLDGSAVKI
jgi:hypothetical protein